jgi:RNA polymerase sigma-70 factor (ECF subfamily)
VINSTTARQGTRVSLTTSTADCPGGPDSPEARSDAARPLLDDQQMRELVHAHFDFIWRQLRRLGVPAASVDDAAQHVFLVASRKMTPVPLAMQRRFLFAIALRVAADDRRARKQQPSFATGEEAEIADPMPGPEEMLDRRRARSTVDRILESMPLEMRAVFVLFEVEEMTMSEIAELLELPSGTVASRLRRARELYRQCVSRLRAAHRAGGQR